MVFPYMKDLGRFVSIPEDIMDKTMIEYRGDKMYSHGSKCVFFLRKSIFTREEMKRVYQGIYVKKLTPISGELLEYQIYERRKGAVLVKEGRAVCI